ncbi:hypothetical protein GGX14DRAFT_644674, partial [Mycena pura]
CPLSSVARFSLNASLSYLDDLYASFSRTNSSYALSRTLNLIAGRFAMSTTTTTTNVITFLTLPLLGKVLPAAISSAQVILAASLASVPIGTLALTAEAPPAPLKAACIGAAIPWPVWFATLGGTAQCTVHLLYGPGYVKARLGAAPVWRAASAPRPLPAAAPLPQSPDVTASLRSALLSARLRSMRRGPAAVTRPSPLRACSSSDGEADSDSDCDADSSASSEDSDSDYDSDSSSSAVASTAPSSVPPTPTAAATPTSWRWRAAQPKAELPASASASAPRATATADPAKKNATAYVYRGGVTRVMTGGVMLGAGPRCS